MDVLFLAVVEQVELVWAQAVDEIAGAVVDQHRRHHFCHADADGGGRRLLRGRRLGSWRLRELLGGQQAAYQHQ